MFIAVPDTQGGVSITINRHKTYLTEAEAVALHRDLGKAIARSIMDNFLLEAFRRVVADHDMDNGDDGRQRQQMLMDSSARGG